MTDNPGPKKTVRVTRRRQGASSGPEGRERPQMPSRERPRPSTPPPPTGGGGTGGGGGYSGGGLGGGLSSLGGSGCGKMPIGLVLLLVVGYFIFQLLFANDGQAPMQEESFPAFPTEQEDVLPGLEPQEEAVLPTPTRRPTRPPAAGAAPGATTGQKWTVMLYMDADDKILEQDIYMDLNEVEKVGSTDRVQVVAQMDRFRGGFSADGNWTDTRRYAITQDQDLNAVRSELVEEIGEANMADGETLADFIQWAAETYPADKYVLILSDHGLGWPGGFSDPDPGGQDASRAPLASALGGDQLFMMEMEDTLSEALQRANIDKFEMIGMDACLMGHLEVLSALQPYAHYAVLSQETEPALGWAYTGFLQELVSNPDMSGAELGHHIVDSYIIEDQRINDSQARAEFLRQGSPMGGLFGSASQVSADALARQLGRGVTLTAVDLAGVPDLIDSLNRLAYMLQDENQEVVASARTYAPSFTNIFGRNGPSPYIDLGGFVQMLKRAGANSQTSQAADAVLASMQNTVIAEKHGDEKRGATGVSIYFPNSTLYRSPVAGPQSYNAIARNFVQTSLWDDFLLYFYNDVGFQAQPAQPVMPQAGSVVRSPGMGQIEVSPITLSSQTASPGNPVLLTTEVSGNNIGYIYLFVGYYDRSANSILVADMDYLESPDTQELNGVYYPVWDESGFNLELEWEPTLFQITDGETTTVTLFRPLTYGSAPEETVYTVEGIYNYADGTSRSARLYFRDGVMRQVFGFTDENHTGSPWEIIPQAGDTFTILESWLDLDDSGQVSQNATQEGATLTFGSQPFEWREVYAAEGNYVIGIIVEDKDGNTQQSYTSVTVQ